MRIGLLQSLHLPSGLRFGILLVCFAAHELEQNLGLVVLQPQLRHNI